MQKNVLITGFDGFVAKYLSEFLLKKKYKVYVTHYKKIKKIKKKNLYYIFCNIKKINDVKKALVLAKPNEIYHLAAKSLPVYSTKFPLETMNVNLMGTMNLLEQCKLMKLRSKIVVACSSAQFGKRDFRKLPLKENDSYFPEHIYGLSKVFTDKISEQYFKMYKLNIFRAIIFNTTGPQKKSDVFSDLLSQYVKQKKKKIIKIFSGDLNKFRDFLHVDDLVKGLYIIQKKGKPGSSYNVCTSNYHSVKKIIDLIVQDAKRSKIQILTKKDLFRKFDEKYIFGSNKKLRKLGWKPINNIKRIFIDICEYYEKKFH